MGGEQNNQLNPKNYGYRIYSLVKGGPLEKSDIKMISDFIIPPEELYSKKITFNDWIKSYSGKKVKIKIYSLLERDFKEVEITANEEGAKDGILGAAVKLENFVTADRNILHIIGVQKDSFADKQLGLVADEDFIIALKPSGYPIIPLNKEGFNPLEILQSVIEQNKESTLEFYIYNENKGARIVGVSIPNDSRFSLGCEGAYGPIHEFPISKNKDKDNNNENELVGFEEKII